MVRHVLINANQSDFALLVETLKMLLQILCRKIRSPGTLVIALAKKVITLILKFIHISHPETNNESFTNCPLYSNRY